MVLWSLLILVVVVRLLLLRNSRVLSTTIGRVTLFSVDARVRTQPVRRPHAQLTRVPHTHKCLLLLRLLRLLLLKLREIVERAEVRAGLMLRSAHVNDAGIPSAPSVAISSQVRVCFAVFLFAIDSSPAQ